MDPIAALPTLQRKPRNVYTFTVPTDMLPQITCDTRSVSLVKLSAEDEIQATERAGGVGSRVAVNLVKQSMVRVNGQPVGLADNSVDKAMENMDPLVRSLVADAWRRLHQAKEDQGEAFFGTMAVEVG